MAVEIDLSKRKKAGVGGRVVTGSVWESRIKLDEIRGGIKVFNGGVEEEEKDGALMAAKGSVSTRRKTWKSEGFSESILFAEEKPLSQSDEEDEEEEEEELNKKSLIHGRKLRSDKSPIHESVKKGVRESNSVLPTKKMDQVRKFGNGLNSKLITKTKYERNKKVGIDDKSFGEFKDCEENVFVDARDDSCSGESEIEKENFDIKEINIPEVKKFHQINGRKTTFSTSESFLGNKQKSYSLMDLLMWRDIFRSGLVFGIGMIIIILSFFNKNFNISFVTVISYLGLLCLAAIFLHRSIICRKEAIDSDDGNYMVGEEEAIWFAKLFLPYINNLLQNLKALFHGDPAITMKLAVVLFVLAKCGSFITIWNVLKWGFVGAFTVPKFCSHYSSQLFTHGEPWVKHVGNSWNSCPHKKGIVIAIFFVVWNFSSIVVRLWAVFVLFVTLRYYQQSSVRDGWVDEVTSEKSSSRGGRLCNGQTVMVSSKQKRKY